MVRKVLFVQGGGEGTHDQWDQKLVASLARELGPQYDIRYPRMPGEDDPHYEPWKIALAQELAKLNDGAILIGHSIGATILLNALADQMPPWTPAGVLLVAAPFVGAGGWPSEEIRSMGDIGSRLPTSVPIHLYYGSEDDTVPPEHIQLYMKAIPQAVIRRLAGRDHQLNDDLAEVAADVRKLPVRPSGVS
jgi:predicted alpha/beta hydrolase family esterase